MQDIQSEDEQCKVSQSWEDEFGDELNDMPPPNEEGFDPLGDLKLLEDLLYNQMPSVGINQEPEEEIDDKSSQPTKPREKARKEPKDRISLKVRRWSTVNKKPFNCKHDQSSRYMPCIRFFPGKYKCWWSDPFKGFKLILKASLNFTANFLNVFVDRVELNGLDRVQIKEKPPD